MTNFQKDKAKAGTADPQGTTKQIFPEFPLIVSVAVRACSVPGAIVDIWNIGANKVETKTSNSLSAPHL